MDSKKIGIFIANLRKKNNMTQAEFGEKLCVTSQAVSKWENGRGIPDISILQKISETFNIDISYLLTGKKSKNKSIIYFVLLVIIIGVVIALMFINHHDELKAETISSNNPSFNVSGIAAYSNDKKLIYISNIKYVSDENKDDKYVVMECTLYEKTTVGEKKITTCGNLNSDKIYNTSKSYTLDDLLSQVTFNVDYVSNCKSLSSHNLYLSINALDINNKVINYNVPLEFESKCN